MTATVRQMKRKAAKKPEARTVTVDVPGFPEWQCTARADFPAKILADLQSDQIDRIFSALDAVILDHNFPDMAGDIAAAMTEVDPYEGALAAAAAVFDAFGKLPNR